MTFEKQRFDNPYPLRASALSGAEIASHVEPLPLDENDWKVIHSFEGQFLFVPFEAITKIDVDYVTIYPKSFANREGARLVSMIYGDPTLQARVREALEPAQLDWNDSASTTKVFKAVWEDFKNVVKEDALFEQYNQHGCDLPNLTKIVGELTNREAAQVHILPPPALPVVEENVYAIEKAFRRTNFEQLPEALREQMYIYSSDAAQAGFINDFKTHQGNLAMLGNPYRIRQVENEQKLLHKIEDCHSYKKRLRGIKKDIRTLKDSWIERGMATEIQIEALNRVLHLYSEYLNMIIAGTYKYARTVADQRVVTQSPIEEKILAQFAGLTRGEIGRNARSMSRINKFINGAGNAFDQRGMVEPIPEPLALLSEQRLAENPPDKPEITPKVVLNAQQVKEIFDEWLLSRGLQEDVEVVISEKAKRMRVGPTQVTVPASYSVAIENALPVMGHEAEGHVLRYLNSDRCLTARLHLTTAYKSPRSMALSELNSMQIEAETAQLIGAPERKSKPYYYVALRAKEAGASFKGAYLAMLEARLQREHNLTVQEFFAQGKDKDEKFQKMLKVNYTSLVRIFFNDTSLEDTSGYLGQTDELDYIEGELILPLLKKNNLEWMLSVQGVDLYTVEDQLRLGLIDLKDVLLPDQWFAQNYQRLREKYGQATESQTSS